jgi:phosphatidylinositol phospholipase C delta
LDGEYKTLHIVPDTADICKLYKDAIEKLLAIRQGLMEMSVNSEVRQDVWERQYFKGADVQGDQVLDFDDVRRLCLRLNVNLTNQELVRLFKVRTVVFENE